MGANTYMGATTRRKDLHNLASGLTITMEWVDGLSHVVEWHSVWDRINATNVVEVVGRWNFVYSS